MQSEEQFNLYENNKVKLLRKSSYEIKDTIQLIFLFPGAYSMISLRIYDKTARLSSLHDYKILEDSLDFFIAAEINFNPDDETYEDNKRRFQLCYEHYTKQEERLKKKLLGNDMARKNNDLENIIKKLNEEVDTLKNSIQNERQLFTIKLEQKDEEINSLRQQHNAKIGNYNSEGYTLQKINQDNSEYDKQNNPDDYEKKISKFKRVRPFDERNESFSEEINTSRILQDKSQPQLNEYLSNNISSNNNIVDPYERTSSKGRTNSPYNSIYNNYPPKSQTNLKKNVRIPNLNIDIEPISHNSIGRQDSTGKKSPISAVSLVNTPNSAISKNYASSSINQRKTPKKQKGNMEGLEVGNTVEQSQTQRQSKFETFYQKTKDSIQNTKTQSLMIGNKAVRDIRMPPNTLSIYKCPILIIPAVKKEYLLLTEHTILYKNFWKFCNFYKSSFLNLHKFIIHIFFQIYWVINLNEKIILTFALLSKNFY